jgi:Cu(I)/Ag(I) efflux system membrane protein CusA/SilA
MLSTGLRSPMGLKVFGPDLNAIETAGLQLEKAFETGSYGREIIGLL